MFFKTILFLAMCFGIAISQTDVEKRIYKPLPVNPHAPEIDGKLTDAIWQKTPRDKGFLQTSPNEGKPASQPTEFMIAYDAKNLYVAIVSLDSVPEKIVDSITRRDQAGESDRVLILLDSFFDKRTAFYFGVNAAGVKMDGVMTEDGDYDDMNWDPIWEVGTRRIPEGWVAEMRIPLSQLRFADRDEHTWGLQVARYFYRNNEWSMWQFYPSSVGGFVSYFGEMQGMTGLETPRQIELLPYSLSQFSFFPDDPDDPFLDGRDGKIAGGLDGKIGITSDLTLNFTVNPDFGQVEADPSEVNLSAFETFFQEKRPFFIEGSNIFTYTLGFGDGSDSRESLFYSRRLGRQPQYEPDLDDNEYMQMPDNTSIIAAAKVTGKTHNGLSIGVLNAFTARERAAIELNGVRRKEIVEPATNYFVGRLQKDFSEGNTSIGGIATATNRDISSENLRFLNTAAYTGGFDVRHNWHNKDYWISLKTAFSRIEGDPDALIEAQTSSRRYFQRPDAPHLTLDSTRTSLDGHAGAFGIGRSNGHIQGMLGGTWRSPGFEINDLGYMRSADRILQFSWLSYREWKPQWIFREYRFNLNQWTGWNFDGEQTFRGMNINGGGRFANNWQFWGGTELEASGLDASGLRGGPMLRYQGAIYSWWSINSDDTKPFQVEIGGFNSFKDDDVSRSREFYGGVQWRPAKSMSLSLQPFFNINKRDLQYVETTEFSNADRYIFARIDQKTTGVIVRANYSITPTLSFQYYGQPFVSAGKYSHYKRITDPRAERYEDRFENIDDEISKNDDEVLIDEDADGSSDYSFDIPDFNFQEFRSNLVVRWEFRPGSTVYFVWAQQRDDSFNNGNFNFRRNVDSLFGIDPENIFLLKFNYWFSL